MAGLFGSKAQAQIDRRLNAIEVNQSAYGNAIPLTYGKTRVPMTLLWYDKFTATPHTTQQAGGKGGGGKSSNTTFSYSAAVIMALGEGPCVDVLTIWADKAQTNLAGLGLTFFPGGSAQGTWSFLTTNFPSAAIPYDRTAYVANGSFQLGNSAALPNLTFELRGLQVFNAGTIDDAEPSAILIDYCTNVDHGCGFQYLSGLQGTGVTTFESYCIAMGFFISPSERTQRPAAEFIREILNLTNSEANWTGDGHLNIKPLADQSVTGNGRTYTPNLTPLFAFTDDDYLFEEGEDPVQVMRKDPAQRFNRVRVEFLNRANQYNTDIAEATDRLDIETNGERTLPTIPLHGIQTASVARQVAQLILQRQLYVVNSYRWRVRADYCLLEPLDYVSLTDSTIGLTNKLVRLTSVEDDDEDQITLEGEEVLVGTAGAPLYNWQGAQGYAANYNASPGPVSTPLIFSAPPMLVDTNGGYEVWIAVAGAGALWGGCDVYMSLDNASYGFVGTISGPARYGTLTAALASNADPDTSHTLAVQLAVTTQQLVSGAAADYNENRTLIYFDGEIGAYQTATLTGPGAYNLTNLRRGQYGSAPASHAIGTSFARIDGAIFRIPLDPGMIGKTAYFKFCSFNVYGGAYEGLGTVATYSKALTLANGGQLTPGPLTLVATNNAVSSGDRVFKSGGAAAYDSQVSSIQSYKGGAYVSFRPSQSNLSFIVGLNADPLTNSDYTSLDYGLIANQDGNLYATESGGVTPSLGAYSRGDDLSVIYDGSIVRYTKNGAVIREAMAGPDRVFFLDSSIYSPGATFTDVRFGPYGQAVPLLFYARGNALVSDTTAMKSNAGGVGFGWGDADVVSIRGYPNCHLSFKGNQTNCDLVVGFNTDPLTDADYASLDGCFGLSSSGNWNIYESGALQLAGPAYSTKTLFAMTCDGATLSYLVDGVVVRTTTYGGGTLIYLDSSFYTPGAGVNSLRFGPTTNLAVADTAQIGANAATSVPGRQRRRDHVLGRRLLECLPARIAHLRLRRDRPWDH
jgi:hypothetical protein